MAKTQNTAPATDALDVALSKLPTVSARIRHLSAAGFKRSQIAKKLNIRYQHVRNVLTAPAPKKKELL